MTDFHSQEEKQFSRLFRDEGLDRVNDRLEILKTFLGTEEHITSNKMVQLLKEKGHDFDSRFVRDTLRLLCRYGFAFKREFKGRKSVYEHRHLGHHHDHMICTKCGGITEFVNQELEKMQKQVAAGFGFHMLQHRMEIYGICAGCLKERVNEIPLTMAKAGEQVIIKNYQGGMQARQRLISMGFRIGDTLDIITNDSSGQLVVAMDCKRYALGRGLAAKVMAEPVTGAISEKICNP